MAIARIRKAPPSICLERLGAEWNSAHAPGNSAARLSRLSFVEVIFASRSNRTRNRVQRMPARLGTNLESDSLKVSIHEGANMNWFGAKPLLTRSFLVHQIDG